MPVSIKQDFYPEFNSVSGVNHIQGVATKGAVFRLEETVEYVVVKGVGSDYNWHYFQDFLVEGKLPDYSNKLSLDILISKYFADRLQLKVGDNVNTLFFRTENRNKPPRIRPFKIVGIYDSGFKEFDEQFAISDIRHIQRLNKWKPDQVGNFEVFVDDYDNLQGKSVEIFKAIPSTLNAVSVKQKFSTVFEWIGIFDKNTTGIILIMILVAGINMITALLVLILERTKMIGILKALGNSNVSTRKIFLYNACYLILVGLFWGNLIGLCLIIAQKLFGFLRFPNPEQYYMSVIPVHISIDYVIALNIGTFVLCLLMLLIPSYVITKISPVKAMRFE